MSERDSGPRAPRRPVWRRSPEPAPIADSDEPLRCGGPERSVAEIFYMMRERRRAKQAEEAKERAEAEARSRRPAPRKRADEDEDEDEQKATERFRNDRYAVKLLHQEDSVWGGDGGADQGTLG